MRLIYQTFGLWIAATTIFLIIPTHPVVAEDEIYTIHHRLVGEWHAEGVSFGAPSHSVMRWEQALDGVYFHIDYTITMQSDNGEQVFHGIGYYRAAGQGFWADNSGDLHPLEWQESDNAITTIWGKAGGKMGRTRYTLIDDDTVEVVDWLLTDDGWREFNRTLFTRSEEAAK